MSRIYVNRALTWFHFLLFVQNLKSVNDNFTHFLGFEVKNLSILEWFDVKSLQLCEWGIIGNSWDRTEVKCDSVKCELIFNFLFTSILDTVNASLVPAGTNFFKPREMRVLFKRGYNSRAVTITKFTVSDSKKSEFSPNIS